METQVHAPADNAAEFTWRHDDVFGRIASRYDLLCDVFSFGIHRLWKRKVARRIAGALGLKICNRQLVFAEAFRVLRPGGRLIVLEASNIRSTILHQLYLAYMSICMPALGWLATGGDASAYRYLLRGIREFPSAEALAAEIHQHGFQEVTFERQSLGIVAIHAARKPRAG